MYIIDDILEEEEFFVDMRKEFEIKSNIDCINKIICIRLLFKLEILWYHKNYFKYFLVPSKVLGIFTFKPLSDLFSLVSTF